MSAEGAAAAASSDAARSKAFRREARAQLRRLPPQQKAAAKRIVDVLAAADAQIRATLAAEPSDYQLWRLGRLQASIESALAAAGAEIGRAVAERQAEAWALGVDLVDKPLVAGGASAAVGRLASVDVRQLAAMREFLTERMLDVGYQTASKINAELGLAMVGARSVSETVDAVGRLVGGGRDRALTIARTEIGRAYSAAGQARLEQAVGEIPGLRKQWRKSGKIHSRLSHALADGQVQKVQAPFKVGGVEIMFPRAPGVPVAHSVNCGCASLPWMADWEMSHPLEAPITDLERSGQTGALADQLRRQDVREWVADVVDGGRRLAKESRTVGRITGEISDGLRKLGRQPVSLDLAVSDGRLAHMLPSGDRRAHKVSKGLPPGVVKRLPDILEAPKAALWDSQTKSLLYVTDVPGEERLGVVAFRLGDRDAKARKLAHNWAQTAGLIPLDTLDNGKRFIRLAGSLA